VLPHLSRKLRPGEHVGLYVAFHSLRIAGIHTDAGSIQDNRRLLIELGNQAFLKPRWVNS